MMTSCSHFQSSGSVRRVDAGRWREGDGASTSDARERRAGEGASAEVLCERVRWLCEDCRMVGQAERCDDGVGTDALRTGACWPH